MTKSKFITWSLFVMASVFLLVTKSNGAVAATATKNHIAVLQLTKKKPLVAKRLFSKVYTALLKAQKPGKILKIVGAILAFILVAFFAFGAAYGGASGAVVVLILILGFGLIAYGLVKLSKKRKMGSI